MPPKSSNSLPEPYFLDVLDLDYRAEILAAALIDNQLTPERLIMNPIGLHTRAYAKDVTTLDENVPIKGSDKIYTRIDTPRESLFDMLPQYLFCEPHPMEGISDTEQILDEIRQDDREAQQGRLFFLPFDSELLLLRSLSVHYDNAIDQFSEAQILFRPFSDHWPILKEMNSLQKSLFLQALPWLHQQRSDLPWLAGFLELFFSVPVSICAGRHLKQPVVAENVLSLSVCRLGIDAVVGTSFDDGNNGIQIIVGPVPDDQIPDFLPNTSTMELLQKLLHYFLPISTEFSISVKTLPPANGAPPNLLLFIWVTRLFFRFTQCFR